MKILNLYAGIGGNRKFWGDEHEITAVELDAKIASIYQDFFPSDNVIVGDAHTYLEKHFEEYDFIWSSPPCPTHSHIRKELGVEARGNVDAVYPDMTLYQEILFLDGYFKGSYVVENVVSWYDPLLPPQKIDSHYYWAKVYIPEFRGTSRDHHGTIESLQKRKGFDLSKYSGIDKRKVLRNCVEPKVGNHILYYVENPYDYQITF